MPKIRNGHPSLYARIHRPFNCHIVNNKFYFNSRHDFKKTSFSVWWKWLKLFQILFPGMILRLRDKTGIHRDSQLTMNVRWTWMSTKHNTTAWQNKRQERLFLWNIFTHRSTVLVQNDLKIKFANWIRDLIGKLRFLIPSNIQSDWASSLEDFHGHQDANWMLWLG